jgi:hypothetical protein
MSMSGSTPFAATETSSGLLAEAVGGIATIVLAILGLSGLSPEYLLAIATIVFGAALVIEGTSIVADYAHILSQSSGAVTPQVGASGISTIFLAGFGGVILGILALLGLNSTTLISAAIIVYGSALLLSSGVTISLHALKAHLAGDLRVVEAPFEAAGVKMLAGMAAIVLGILAAAGTVALKLDLVALLVLGAGILATGNGLNNAMTSVISAVASRSSPAR